MQRIVRALVSTALKETVKVRFSGSSDIQLLLLYQKTYQD